MPIEESQVDIKKIGKIAIFLILIFAFVVLLFPEIFGVEVVIELAAAGILFSIFVVLIASIPNKLNIKFESKEISVDKLNKKTIWKVPPMIYYLAIVSGVICIAFSVNALLSGELTMVQRYTSRGILVSRDANQFAYWLAIIAFGFSGILLVVYPIINNIKYHMMNKNT